MALKRVTLAVRDFALPVPRVGSIETHSGYGPMPQTGQEWHTMLQMQRAAENANYQSEVVIRQTFALEGYEFVISGRMDGVFRGEPTVIEEIKSTFRAEELRERLQGQWSHPYCLQLRTYGYFYFLQTQKIADLRLHIVGQRGQNHVDLEVPLEIEDYRLWLDRRLVELVGEEKVHEAIVKRRHKMARQFAFPFAEYRPAQTEMIEAIESSLQKSQTVLMQAPTGVGKTVGVLYPVLKEALTRGQQVIYVTPKNSQQLVAEHAARQFHKVKVRLKTLTIQAKAKACFKNEPVCNPEHCEFARDHYQKMHAHDVVGKLAKFKNWSSKRIAQIARTYEVCPFELSLEAIARADLVICDYNYVFSPRAILGRFRDAGSAKKQRPNLVIDEFHNLPSRAADYFSPKLSAQTFLRLRESIDQLPAAYANKGLKLVDQCLNIMASYRPLDRPSAQITLNAEEFQQHEVALVEFAARYLSSPLEIQAGDPVLRLMQVWSEFTGALAFFDETFFATFQDLGRGEFVLKITCCDPAPRLQNAYEQFAQVVAFSATVKPFEYYSRLAGLDAERLQTFELGSPFPRENRKILIIPQVSTKYSERAWNYQKIASAIERITDLRHGNYFVFFPSFAFMREVQGRTQLPWARVLMQKPEMKQHDVVQVIEQLKEVSQPTVVFAVQGGVLSEGVDYPGDMIIGAIIVGPALPTFDLERELLRSYYERQYGAEWGFAYAYSYPAMTKVVQAAGRVIRSAEEKGLIVLMDQRFLSPLYTQSMPQGWFDENPSELVSSEISKDIRDFWESSV